MVLQGGPGNGLTKEHCWERKLSAVRSFTKVITGPDWGGPTSSGGCGLADAVRGACYRSQGAVYGLARDPATFIQDTRTGRCAVALLSVDNDLLVVF